MSEISLIAIGASTGGVKALEYILPQLPADFSIPIVIVQHIHKDANKLLLNHLQSITKLAVKEAADEMLAAANTVFLAPPGYHLLIEKDHRFSLCVGEKVNYCRPSIDVFFETAAEVYQASLLGILLSGGNHDGTKGCSSIKDYHGYVIVQDPDTCEAITMPKSAIIAGIPDAILSLKDISTYLLELGHAK